MIETKFVKMNVYRFVLQNLGILKSVGFLFI